MELYYKRYGDGGPPLLILHGLLGASGNWHTLSRNVFSERFRVFAVDLRNHGRSPHSDVLDYPSMAGDVQELIAQEDLALAHVLGHSMGGKVAMQLALEHSEQVDRLIVADIAPKAYPPKHEEILDALQSLDLSAHDSRDDVDEALSERITARPVRQFLLKNLNYDGDSGYTWTMNLESIVQNYDHISADIEADGPFDKPTLFVRGEQSEYVADEDEERIKELFPQAKITTLPKAGHWLHADDPEAFAEAVMSFLEAETAGGS